MSTPIGTLVLLGASGDLAGRLLLPALGHLMAEEPQRNRLMVIGAGVEDWDDETWKARIRASFESARVPAETTDAVVANTRYQQADVTQAEDLRTLIGFGPAPPALYFALPPAVTFTACQSLREVELPSGTALALEKPFGTNQESAAGLNALLTELVPETQVYRVDHFLGRSTVLNLLGVRFANRLFEPVWNNQYIDHVDIVFDEQLTLENRAGYYDSAGALTDMIQSHLLQIMAIVAMQPPARVDEVDLRDGIAQTLRATRLWAGAPLDSARRARYTNGTIDGRSVPDYVAEPGVDAARNTETLAELTVEVDNWRWAGVPFRLRSGKSLGSTRKEVVITFKQLPHLPTGLQGKPLPDRFRLSMSPDRMALEINVNGPSDPLVLDRVSLGTDLTPGRLPAYGEILAGLLDGDALLSIRGDVAEECWRLVDPVLHAWRSNQVPMDSYPAGSAGPRDWN